ncbi:MAG TPA: HEAT repeat domain-containing protein [Verrucomicrobiae bacterium]
MRNFIRAWSVPLCLLGCICFFTEVTRAAEPSLRDKVIEHLERLHYGPTQPREAERKRLLALGTNAVPILIELVGYKETKLEETYRKTYYESPEAVRQTMSRPRDLEGLARPAAWELLDMPECKDYLRKLLPLLQDSRSEVRELTARVIATHVEAVRKTDRAFPLELVQFLKDNEAGVRRRIINALQFDITTLPRVKSALEGMLADKDDAVRNSAALALLLEDKGHAAALVAIRAFFSSTNESTRINAGLVYVIKQPNSPVIQSEVLPLFVRSLSSTNESAQTLALSYIRGYAPHFTATVPEVQKLLAHPSLRVRQEATNTLRGLTNNVPRP